MTYDTDMKVDIYQQNKKGFRDHLATFIVDGIDELLEKDVMKK